MYPSINALRTALCDPTAYFNTLRGLIVAKFDGLPQIICSSDYALCEIVWQNNRCLLSMPLSDAAMSNGENIQTSLRSLHSAVLGEMHILHDEMLYKDSTGNLLKATVFCRELPTGPTLQECVGMYDSRTLLDMSTALHAEMQQLGLVINDLRPSNFIVGKDGRLYPKRYANIVRSELPETFDTLNNYILANAMQSKPTRSTLNDSGDENARYTTSSMYDMVGSLHEGVAVVCRNGLYGYIDDEGRPITPLQYLEAEPFREGRAVVRGMNGAGLINKRGEEVIPAIFADAQYDEVSGNTEVQDGKHWVTYSYTGELIKKSNK